MIITQHIPETKNQNIDSKGDERMTNITKVPILVIMDSICFV